MKILGIESSCDETAAAIAENGKTVLANEIASSVVLHQKTGGIVPEIAARDAAEKILPIIERAFSTANLSWKDIDAIAVTNGPGLAGSLLVGIETARTLAFLHTKPLIPVHHIIGHIYANVLEREEVIFPALVLTVSGGHNNLILWRDFLDFALVGETRDDAAGEAFDKVAKMLDLPFPGGPAIASLALQGDAKAYKFPRPMQQSGDLDFSFSGLKTAVLYALAKEKHLNEKKKADLAASFQEAVIDSLIFKLKQAAMRFGVREIHLAGGVSANRRLQEKTALLCRKNGWQLLLPVKPIYSTDNAAMIAAAGYFIYQKTPAREWDISKVRLNLQQELPQ